MRQLYGIPTACPVDPGAAVIRGDGLVSVSQVARCLGLSHALVHVWIGQGVLHSEQRVSQSYRWVQLRAEAIARLDGKHDWGQFPSFQQIMAETSCSREIVWEMVRNRQYVAYRHPIGRNW
jgi:hypothetical protein